MSRMCRGCRTVNPPRVRKCQACSKALPKKRKPKHLVALELGYEVFVAAGGGLDACGICGTTPKPGGKKLHRDHWHNGPKAGRPRGVLCFRDNSALRAYMDEAWLQAALDYVRRAA